MFTRYDRGTADRRPDGYPARPQSATVQTGLDELDLAVRGFSRVEIDRLRFCQDRFQSGDLNEWGEGYKRLLFARWLYEHDRLIG